MTSWLRSTSGTPVSLKVIQWLFLIKISSQAKFLGILGLSEHWCSIFNPLNWLILSNVQFNINFIEINSGSTKALSAHWPVDDFYFLWYLISDNNIFQSSQTGCCLCWPMTPQSGPRPWSASTIPSWRMWRSRQRSPGLSSVKLFE